MWPILSRTSNCLLGSSMERGQRVSRFVLFRAVLNFSNFAILDRAPVRLRE